MSGRVVTATAGELAWAMLIAAACGVLVGLALLDLLNFSTDKGTPAMQIMVNEHAAEVHAATLDGNQLSLTFRHPVTGQLDTIEADLSDFEAAAPPPGTEPAGSENTGAGEGE